MQLLHFADAVIHRLSCGLHGLHLAQMIVQDPPQPSFDERLTGRRLIRGPGRAGLAKVITDPAQVQAPALRAPVRTLDPRGDDIRIAWRDDSFSFEPVQAGPHGPLGAAL